MVSDKQLNLFAVSDKPANPYKVERQPRLEMSPSALVAWKKRVAEFQHHARQGATLNQTSLLFELESLPSHWDADKLDPFELPRKPWDFYRDRPDSLSEGETNIYFVLDHAVPLLLYVGETKQSIKQRWKGIHYCKEYIDSYVSLHRKYNLEFAVNMAFNVSAPKDRTQRLKLERELILRWRSPFNKEAWRHWGQPFRRYAKR